MRIQFERTGGFAGMRVATTIDMESLSADEARELREMGYMKIVSLAPEVL